jgi:aminoglycoside 3-N-acetyltransferase
MSEIRELTRNDIAQALRALGLEPGFGVIVHSSFKALGSVRGGPIAVISALMDVLTPQGTLMMPSFNHAAPFREGEPGIYDPGATPTSDGIIADTFWRLPGVRRSLDPTHPFAVWGKHRDRYVEGHHRTSTMGPSSPIGLLLLDGGWQLNLGTTHRTTTAKHLAETLHGAPCLAQRSSRLRVRLPSGEIAEHSAWAYRNRPCPLTESGELIAREMDRLGLERTSHVGPCRAALFELRDCVRVIRALLERGHGSAPPCSRCPIRPEDG